MKIYNTMTGKKEEFEPIKKGEAKIYACGVTVYDLSHIGHARQAIVYEMITKYLKYRGYKVTYVRNYTDVDDKIINRANQLGKNALDFSKEQIKESEIDMANLHVQEADKMTKASEYIEKIINFIQGLIDKGYAYQAKNGDVYYSVKAFPEYGKLSHRKVDELINGVRIEVDEDKKDPVDFALWKSAKPGEIYWESPYGKGRPGWHIECSVMIYDTLGETIDIHGGGRDLQFPHHENEIAQSEALTGKTLAKYWTHCGLIKINGEKMSKSLGNSLTIRDALKEYNYEVIKYLLLSKHYTSDIDISDSDFQVAEKHLYYFYTTIKQMTQFIENYKGEATETLEDDIADKIIPDFINVMDDDFNSAGAISYLHAIFKYANNIMKNAKKSNRQITANTLSKIIDNLKNCYSVLGLFEQEPEEFIKTMQNKYLERLEISEDYIKEQIEKRAQAKKEKDYVLADEIRSNLEEKGIILSDMAEGTKWDIKVGK